MAQNIDFGVDSKSYNASRGNVGGYTNRAMRQQLSHRENTLHSGCVFCACYDDSHGCISNAHIESCYVAHNRDSSNHVLNNKNCHQRWPQQLTAASEL